MPAMTAAAVRRPLDGGALALMVLLTMLWGLQQVAIKLALPGVSPVTQAAVRSAVAILLLLGWARARGIDLWQRDGTLRAGIIAGLLFGAEFVFIYAGLEHTTASRMVVFIYLAPILTALGLARYVPGERLTLAQWGGVAVAFIGIVLAFADHRGGGTSTLLGDACGAIGAALWAATTVLVRSSRLSEAKAEKTLAYQLGVSALVLPLAAWLLGEPGFVRLDTVALASLLFQSVVVAFASYLAWFWLLTRYLAGRLAVFSFLAPMFGVLFGVLLLGEPLRPRFLLAAACVAGGIALVNLRKT